MRYLLKYILFTVFTAFSMTCMASTGNMVEVGAAQMGKITSYIGNKRIGVVVNQTSRVGEVHLLDTLIASGIRPRTIFAPEHGYRGNADAGEYIKNGRDVKTNIQIISLYGKNKKPLPTQLKGIDLIIFDIQDVGARFYTYVSTLYYVMQACAENNKEVLILDRPNPCDYIDGPILEKGYRSFVGMLPIPVLHGCTMGEMALMMNGEGWLGNGLRCKVNVIKVEGWKHQQPYSLPVKPSPNLPNDQAIALYPSLCFFEATSISVGRGTFYPFQMIGSPLLEGQGYKFSFVPVSLAGFDKHPLHKDETCFGLDLRKEMAPQGISLKYFFRMREEFKKRNALDAFLTRSKWFDLLMGTNKTRLMIENGKTEKEIKDTWKEGLDKYKSIRKKYLLYAEQETENDR